MRGRVSSLATIFQNKRGRFLLGIASAYLVFLFAFAYVASGVRFFPGEQDFSIWVQSWRSDWLDAVMLAVSAPGFQVGALPIIGLTLLLLFVKGKRQEGGLLLFGLLVASGINFALKELVARPRPTHEFVQVVNDAEGFSFPSGHVMSYVVFLGILGVILTQNMRPCARRRLVYAALALALIAVGVSRIYLGAHWLGDVIGGYVFGGGVVLGAALLMRLWLNRNDTAQNVNDALTPRLENLTDKYAET